MRIVYEATPANTAKAQELLGKDDIAGRQSIYIRTPGSIGMTGEKNFLILDGTEAGMKRVDELLEGIAEKSKHQEEVLKKFDEVENASAAGFGFLGI